jgi:hypothetical protein
VVIPPRSDHDRVADDRDLTTELVKCRAVGGGEFGLFGPVVTRADKDVRRAGVGPAGVVFGRRADHGRVLRRRHRHRDAEVVAGHAVGRKLLLRCPGYTAGGTGPRVEEYLTTDVETGTDQGADRGRVALQRHGNAEVLKRTELRAL